MTPGERMGGNRFLRLRRMIARFALFAAQVLLGLLLSKKGNAIGPALGLIALPHHPRPDIRRTIAKDNASSGLLLS